MPVQISRADAIHEKKNWHAYSLEKDRSPNSQGAVDQQISSVPLGNKLPTPHHHRQLLPLCCKHCQGDDIIQIQSLKNPETGSETKIYEDLIYLTLTPQRPNAISEWKMLWTVIQSLGEDGRSMNLCIHLRRQEIQTHPPTISESWDLCHADILVNLKRRSMWISTCGEKFAYWHQSAPAIMLGSRRH